MRLIPLESPVDVAQWAAQYIIHQINTFQPTVERPFILGLPTGGTPLSTYKCLIQEYKAGNVSFKNVVTFNMDEYVGLSTEHPESYHSFMFNNFFSHIDIPSKNINLLDGNAVDLVAECSRYEDKIASLGGIHLFMGGVGIDGHIAFNEPYSSLSSLTRCITLTKSTRAVNSRFFNNNIVHVPKQALTIGVGTLLSAQEVMILAVGENKAKAIKEAVEGSVNHVWTVSALQLHNNCTFVVDTSAMQELQVETIDYFKEVEYSVLSQS